MNDEKCRFYDGRKVFSCTALVNKKCSGEDTECSFYKTDAQYYDELNYSIFLNRMKGNCEKCKYVVTPCELCGNKG